MRIPSLLLLLLCSGNAAELLRDIHTDTAYIFDSDAKDVAVRIGREDALLRADEWATGFYGDALLEFVTCQFKTQPIRHWLSTNWTPVNRTHSTDHLPLRQMPIASHQSLTVFIASILVERPTHILGQNRTGKATLVPAKNCRPGVALALAPS